METDYLFSWSCRPDYLFSALPRRECLFTKTASPLPHQNQMVVPLQKLTSGLHTLPDTIQYIY